MRARVLSKPSVRKDPLRLAVPPRPAFPAWIDADAGLAYVALVTPRVRDSLVLRLVAPAQTGRGRSASDASRAR